MSRVLAAALATAVLSGIDAGAAQSRLATRVYVVVADAKERAVRNRSRRTSSSEWTASPSRSRPPAPHRSPHRCSWLTDRLGQTSDYRPTDLRKALKSFVEVASGDRIRNEVRADDLRFRIRHADCEVSGVAGGGRSRDSTSSWAPRWTCPSSMRFRTRARRRPARLPIAGFVVPRQRRRIGPTAACRGIDATAERCRASGASLWAIEARASDGRNYPNPARERIVDDTSRMSGGMRKYVQTAAALDSLSRLMGGLVSVRVTSSHSRPV